MDCVLGSVDANGESSFVPRKDVEGQYENVEKPDINYHQPQGLPHPSIFTILVWYLSDVAIVQPKVPLEGEQFL